MSRNGCEPELESWFHCFNGVQEWFVGSTKSLDAVTEIIETYVGWPDETKRRGTNFGEKNAAISRLGRTGGNCVAKELASWEEKWLGVVDVQLRCCGGNRSRKPFRGAQHRTVGFLKVAMWASNGASTVASQRSS
jgi:hypothetical protein